MKLRLILWTTTFLSAGGMAAPIDITTGINTGVYLSSGLNNPQEWKAGLPIEFPVQDYILNKSYSAQIVPTGSKSDVNESYVEFPGGKPEGFSSALTNGAGVLEVGVERNNFDWGLNVAVSRWYTTIKNNTDEEVDFDFLFNIPEGVIEINGYLTNYVAASARVEATIDYLLKTPDEGAYVETREQIFRYYAALINDQLPHGRLVTTDNVTLTNLSTAFDHHSYRIEKFTGLANLPTIPGRGELTIYYDMYAQFFNNTEHNGKAFLGDPVQFVGGPGVSLLPGSASPVPEPATFLMCGAAVLGFPVLRRLRG